ncbi:MAG: neutral/alkaline non-lysosomal ceramidase N-terminal domain-containing protein [Saprospiraceae bacterium]|nr:neutral/alkaline non-lysosomal ceramidase N-terminal domain-containing protein [Saprospiraceae bacterium]
MSDHCFIPPYSLLKSFITILCLASTLAVQAQKEKLRIGYAEVNYTPRIGLDMVGNYRGDDYASRGIHDPLYAKAIVAEGTNGTKAAIVSIDICNIQEATVDYLREYIGSMSDILPANVMIHATHTHSGPPSKLDAPEAKEYLKKAVGAVLEANQQIQPTRLYVGRTTEDRVSHNRRLKANDGTTHMVWEKFTPGYIVESLGSIDPEMITVSMERNGEIVGSIINFSCHPTTLTGNNWFYSADYPGYLTESIKKAKGKDFSTMFINGTCGNVTQVDHEVGFLDTYQECQRIGYILGISALESMRNAQPLADNGLVRVSREQVPLKKMTITEEQFAWAKEVMDRVAKEGMPPLQADGIPDEVYASKWIKMYEEQEEIDSLEVQVIQIGDLALVGLPGEMFNEFGIYIKENSPFPNTIVMGLANAAAGYFPTKVSFTQGPAGFKPMTTGYETTPGTTYYDIGAGEKLSESAVHQLHKLAELPEK